MKEMTDAYLTSILLLCTEYKEPIKARISTANWLRVEWIGPSGECLRYYQAAKLAQVSGRRIPPEAELVGDEF